MESETQLQRSRRKHSPEFKTEVIQACRQPGVSIRSVALGRGLSPSLVRRWLGSCASGAAAKVARSASQATTAAISGFVAVRVEDQPPAVPVAAIRLELRRSGATVIVEWPAQQATACGAWLGQWLR